MEKYLEASGKTIDDAINSALAELGMDRDSVSVEVLEKPKSGFLGLGGTPARIRVSYSVGRDSRAKAFIEGVLSHMNLSLIVDGGETADGNLAFELKGENIAQLLRHRGEPLDALQHLTATIANKGEETPVRVSLDGDGFRQKREDYLVELAKKTAERVVKYRKNITLDPMNSYSRHVVHAALQDHPHVKTMSIGTDPNRQIVVTIPGGDTARYNNSRPSGGNRPPQQGFRGNNNTQRSR